MSRETATRALCRVLAPVAAIGLAGLLPGVAAAAPASSTFQATLAPLNNSGASGTVMVQIRGDQASVTEDVHGLAATFMGAPYPHVQHIHGLAQGKCPSASADKNGDGVVNTAEGQPAYGAIQTTLSTTGGVGADQGTNVKIAPSGASFHYQRTFTLNAATRKALTGGTAVVVVHGLDPSTLSQQAQNEKSELVPSLPLAATSPALCGALTASQMTSMPTGAADTGGGGTAGTEDAGLLAGGAAALGLAAITATALTRRRRTQDGR